MKSIMVLLAVLVLSACSTWTEKEQQTAWIVAGVLVTGAVIANQQEGDTIINNHPCHGHGQSDQHPCL